MGHSEPAGQTTYGREPPKAVDPVKQKYPAGHGKQAELSDVPPVVMPYVPTGHCTSDGPLATGSKYVPATTMSDIGDGTLLPGEHK